MAKRKSLTSELFLFIREHKAYWMIPIILIVLLLVVFTIFGGTAAAPFIYTIF